MNSLRNAVAEFKLKLNSSLDKCDVSESKLKSCGLRELTLRSYQLDGVKWVVNRFKNGLGCILADEMGLGKTCQTISSLVYMYENVGKTGVGKSLIVCPLSVMSNWQNELTRFAPKVKFSSFIGDQEKRASLKHLISRNDDIRLVLTTFEICMKEASFLGSFDWNILVVDEAHRLKNRQSLLHQNLLQMSFEHRFLLTGTPVQNNLDELYALLCFVAPKIFRYKYIHEFVETYSDVGQGDSSLAGELQAMIEPFILRRIKTEVLKDLPRKSEVVLYHGITALQKKYYKAILQNDIDAFDAPGKMHRTRLANVLMQLRKCVAHPYLFDGVEPEPFQLGEHLVEASGKLIVLDRLLSHLKTHGHKVLLFSQMTRALDILQDYMTFRGYSYERLDGSVRAEERFLAVNNFNSVADTFVFLLSTKAGGQGLNLTGADTVIFYDSDFNPQNDLQAAARAHRIGQHRNVNVIRLIGRNTVEEIILRRAEDKLKLTHAVMAAGRSNASGDSYKLEDIIKFGLDSLFQTDTDDYFLDDVDFAAILGSTVNGEWQLEVTAASVTTTEDEDDEENEASTSDSVKHMYVFEGKDYSKEPTIADQQAFQQLADAVKAAQLEGNEDSGGRSRRTKPVKLLFSALPEPVARRPKKQLTPEELEERRKKRAERAAERAKEEEEEEIRHAQAKKEKRARLWSSSNYHSCNLGLSNDEDDEDGQSNEGEEEMDVETLESDNEQQKKAIHYVVGDVMKPQDSDGHEAIIVHCVDDSGRWGQGGLFTHITNRSLLPEKQYKLAGKMKDLALGDVHVVAVDDVISRQTGKDMVALVVAQHRDKNNVLSGIKLSALRLALEKLSRYARANKVTIHMPRIGHNTPGFNWYGTERMIQKHLASRGVPTYIYYYSRRQSTKRKSLELPSRTSSSSPLPAKRLRDSTSLDASASATQNYCLPDFLTGVAVHFRDVSPDIVSKLSRYIIAYNGDIHDSLTPDTVYLVSDGDVTDVKSLQPQVQCVTVEWMKQLIAKQKS